MYYPLQRAACANQTFAGDRAQSLRLAYRIDKTLRIKVGVRDGHEKRIGYKAVDLGELYALFSQTHRVEREPFAEIKE